MFIDLARRGLLIAYAADVQAAFVADAYGVPVVLFNPIYVSCYYNQ